MIRNETVTVDIGGTQVYPTSVRITAGIGKGYNSCTINGLNITGSVGDTVTIVVNSDTYTFLVDKKDYGKNDKVIFHCKGLPCTLEDLSPTDTEYTYTDSDELIEDSRGSITVSNNLPTISFSAQSYAKISTPMSRILDMVDVVAGEAWEQNGTLYLAEQKVIEETPTVAHAFTDSEVLDFAYSENRDKSLKVKQVLLNPVSEDIYAEPAINFEYEDSQGEIYFNPSLTAGYGYGINGLGYRPPVRSVKTEIITVDDDSYITTLGGIDDLVNITVDGEPLGSENVDYFLYSGFNIVRFNTPQTGEVEVTYYTKSVSVYVYRDTNFQITYQCMKCEGNIVIEADNVTNNGFCYTEIVEPFTYEDGGSVLITSGKDVTFVFVEVKGATNLVTEKIYTLNGGGTLTVKYLYKDTDWTEKGFMNNITSANKTTIETTKKEILYDEDLDEYVVFLDKPITSINDIYFGSQVLSGYSYVGTGNVPYITFNADDVGKEVDISMNIDLDEITIPAPTAGHPVTLFDVVSCGGVATTRVVLADDELCSLPATFKVDVAGAFDVPIEDCFGKDVTGDFGTLTVDNFGKVEITVSSQGVYTIDCSNIKDNGVITIDSQGVV